MPRESLSFPQKAPKTPKNAPKTPQDCPKTPPRRLQDGILVVFGKQSRRQVGVENRAKIDSKRHRKSDEKKKVNLGRLGRVLGRFKRQKGQRGPRFGGLLCRQEPPNIFEEENLQTSTDPLTTDPDTQLGRFGPGADSKRSKAAYPSPRCVHNHKLNCSILCCKYTKLIVFSQN